MGAAEAERQCANQCMAGVDRQKQACGADRTCQARAADGLDTCVRQCSFNSTSGSDACTRQCEAEANMRPACYGVACRNQNAQLLKQCKTMCYGQTRVMAGEPSPGQGSQCQLQCLQMLQQQQSFCPDYYCIQQLQAQHSMCLTQCAGMMPSYGQFPGQGVTGYSAPGYQGNIYDVQTTNNAYGLMGMPSYAPAPLDNGWGGGYYQAYNQGYGDLGYGNGGSYSSYGGW